MRIDEFNLSSTIDKLFNRTDKEKKKEPQKPDTNDKQEKSPSEKMLEIISKKGTEADYESILKYLETSHKDKFKENLISDFKNAKWYALWGSDGEDFDDLIPAPRFEMLNDKEGGVHSTAEFYKFSVTGENNNMDIMCIHSSDYADGSDDEDNFTEDNVYVGVITKAN